MLWHPVKTNAAKAANTMRRMFSSRSQGRSKQAHRGDSVAGGQGEKDHPSSSEATPPRAMQALKMASLDANTRAHENHHRPR
jgi:hypothetical protein